MKSLVVGAGYLGSEIFFQLKKSGHEVYASKKSGLSFSCQDQEVKALAINVLDPETFKAIPKEINSIIYCVSASGHSQSEYENSYYLGVRNLVSFAKQFLLECRQFTLISSTGVYKENNGGRVDELSEVKFDDPIYKHMCLGEKEVLEKFKYNALVLRLSGIYGPGRNYFVELAKNLSEKQSREVLWSNRIHKIDAARACLFLMNIKKTGIYNVSDELPSTRLETLFYIRSLLNLPLLGAESAEKIENSINNVAQGKKCDISKLLSTGFKFSYPTYKEGYLDTLG